MNHWPVYVSRTKGDFKGIAALAKMSREIDLREAKFTELVIDVGVKKTPKFIKPTFVKTSKPGEADEYTQVIIIDRTLGTNTEQSFKVIPLNPQEGFKLAGRNHYSRQEIVYTVP